MVRLHNGANSPGSNCDFFRQHSPGPLATTVVHPDRSEPRSPGFRQPMSPHTPMKKQKAFQPVERLFSFVLRARIMIIGRDMLARSKSRLHFVLITHDLSENSRKEILADFAYYPVVQHYTSDEVQKFFGIQGAKVIGFKKSGLAQSLYAELKAYRIN
jgi:hypothetical protein